MMWLLRLPLMLVVLCYQSLFLALGQIWANKLRSALTMIGIVIGVASVTAVIAGLTGLKDKVLAEFEAFGTNKIFVFPRWPDTGPMRRGSWSMIRFRPETFDGMLDHCPSLKVFTRLTETRENVSFGERSQENVRVTGIEPAWHEIERRPVVLGRPFSLVDNTQAKPVCLINTALRDKLALDRDCTGQAVTIGARRFIIVGVLEQRPSGMFGDTGADLEVYVPFETLYTSNWRPLWVVAASKSPELSEEAKGEVTFYLRKKKQLKPGMPDTFGVEFVEQFVRQFSQIATVITMVAGGIVGISLLVGGVGIMNIMLVSVSERTREIGLRKAVGAPPAAILLQFLVEAVALCLVGGLIGLFLGEMFTTALASIPGAQLEKAAIPGWAVALSFGFAAAVGVIFGMFPAIKAARLDPIEALRHE